MYITNAFSLQMLDLTEISLISVKPISLEEVKSMKDNLVSALGHQDIANVLSEMIGVKLPVNRISNKLEFDEPILVAQFTGGRLPEGATKLPEGFTIKFVLVKKLNPHSTVIKL